LINGTIKVNIKTFNGSRKVFSIDTDVIDSFEVLKAKLISADAENELAKCKLIRFYYPMVSAFTYKNRAKLKRFPWSPHLSIST
jgi:hypothetical protein